MEGAKKDVYRRGQVAIGSWNNNNNNKINKIVQNQGEIRIKIVGQRGQLLGPGEAVKLTCFIPFSLKRDASWCLAYQIEDGPGENPQNQGQT